MKGKKIKSLLLIAIFILSTITAIIPISHALHTSTATVAFTAGESKFSGAASILDVIVTNNGPQPISTVKVDFTGTDFTGIGVGALPTGWAGSVATGIVTYTGGPIASDASETFVPTVTNPTKIGLATNPVVKTTDEVKAKLSMNPGTDHEIDYVADIAGVAGNSITIEYTEAATDSELVVTVATLAISVELADTAGTITSTAVLVVAAINAHAGASDLVDATTGVAGLMEAMAATALSGGIAPTTDYIAPVTGDLTVEGIELDSDGYRTGEIVTVTVGDETANSAPTVREIISVKTKSVPTNPDEITIALRETNVNTGIFTGTFSLVDFTPGPGQLLVSHLDIITVTYYTPDPDWSVTATVDDVAPVVVIDEPLDEAFVTGTSVIIDATVTEDNPDIVVLKIDGVVVLDEFDDPVSLPYTWDTTAEEVVDVPDWPDGTYTVTVIATDTAGNVGSDSITVTVDNTEPEIVNELANPSVIEPNTGATFVFTAEVSDAGSGVETVTINLGSIVGGPAVPMLDDGVEPDVTADDGIYTTDFTTTGLPAGTYDVTITAIDVEGNSMTTLPITIVSSLDIVPPVISDETITYPIGVFSARLGDPVVISAAATDVEGVETVTVSDALDPHVLTDVPMLDDGLGSDVTADDGIYTLDIPSLAGFLPGSYVLTITATDINSNVGTATVTLVVAEKLTGYNVPLVEGWNLMSLPLIPDAPSVTIVLADIVTDIESVWSYDAATSFWSSYSPGAPSDMTVMVDGKGYWINMDADATLIISGVELPAPPTLPPTYYVVEGWNLIGFKSVESIQCQVYLAGVIDDCVRIYGFSDGTYDVLVSGNAMEPGFGYWIAMTAPGSIYP